MVWCLFSIYIDVLSTTANHALICKLTHLFSHRVPNHGAVFMTPQRASPVHCRAATADAICRMRVSDKALF